jgi:hypothetical protein
VSAPLVEPPSTRCFVCVQLPRMRAIEALTGGWPPLPKPRSLHPTVENTNTGERQKHDERRESCDGLLTLMRS